MSPPRLAPPLPALEAAPHSQGWSGLLELFYERLGLPLPPLGRVKDTEMPQPYRGLLAHSTDMTPTLENYYREPLALTVLGRRLRDETYDREVVLSLQQRGQPVEYGVIRIHLDRLPPVARGRVLEEQAPLGRILLSEAVPHLSWPQAFFRIQCDAHIGPVLAQPPGTWLYGRRNVLLDGARRLLAEVIEILPSAEQVRPGH